DVYDMYNMTIPSLAIPPGFPFTKGRIFANVSHHGNAVYCGHMDMELKEKIVIYYIVTERPAITYKNSSYISFANFSSRRYGRASPMYFGDYHMYNMSIPSVAIPPGFPFTKGRIYANATRGQDYVLCGHIDMELKEKLIRPVWYKLHLGVTKDLVSARFGYTYGFGFKLAENLVAVATNRRNLSFYMVTDKPVITYVDHEYFPYMNITSHRYGRFQPKLLY
ncbi:hypothetical protein MSG28_012970, partial [Choristoneura fumiferana]